MPTRTDEAQMLFTFRCTCGIPDESYLHRDECEERVADHNATHEIRHTCSFSDALGQFTGTADCTACLHESLQSPGRRRSA